MLDGRQERKKVKSHLNFCLQLIFAVLSISRGMWLQGDFIIDFADHDLQSQVDAGRVVYAAINKSWLMLAAPEFTVSANSDSVQLRYLGAPRF